MIKMSLARGYFPRLLRQLAPNHGVAESKPTDPPASCRLKFDRIEYVPKRGGVTVSLYYGPHLVGTFPFRCDSGDAIVINDIDGSLLAEEDYA